MELFCWIFLCLWLLNWIKDRNHWNAKIHVFELCEREEKGEISYNYLVKLGIGRDVEGSWEGSENLSNEDECFKLNILSQLIHRQRIQFLTVRSRFQLS